jgi:hypothetical protein
MEFHKHLSLQLLHHQLSRTYLNYIIVCSCLVSSWRFHPATWFLDLRKLVLLNRKPVTQKKKKGRTIHNKQRRKQPSNKTHLLSPMSISRFRTSGKNHTMFTRVLFRTIKISRKPSSKSRDSNRKRNFKIITNGVYTFSIF